MSAKIDFHLNPDSRFDTKWLKTDIEEALKKNQVLHYWNELLKDGELVINKCYNSKTTTPESESEVFEINNLSQNNLNYSTKLKSDISHLLQGTEWSQKLIDLWTWSKNYKTETIIHCINLLQKEQQSLYNIVGGNTISSCRLQQRVVVAYRYFSALARHMSCQNFEQNKIVRDVKENSSWNVLDGECSVQTNNNSTEFQKNIFDLARIGTKTALNFAFAFLRRAWRSGEDCDICSEVLQETLEALQNLPEALLFDESKVSPVWIEILNKSSTFLQQVILCDVADSSSRKIPLVDRQYALRILLELAIQRGTITALIDMILLLLILSERKDCLSDNRLDQEECLSPLVPFLKRFQKILCLTSVNLKNCDFKFRKDNDDTGVCPTECFLRFLVLPNDDETIMINVKLAAVIMTCYLNRLIIPYLPTVSFMQKKKLYQMVFAWGWLPWESRNKTKLCETLDELGVTHIALSDKYLFFISFEKKLYFCNYINDPQNVELISTLSDKSIIDIAVHPEGQHYLALTSEGTVYSWGNGEGGRLGHGDYNSQEYPVLIEALLGHTIVRIASGSNYSAAITSQGELFTWGRGNCGRLGHGTNNDLNIPLIVEAVKDVKIVDVACGCGDAHTLAVTNAGLVYSWGDGDYGKLGRGGNESSKIPKLIEALFDVKIIRVFCGSQFSVALTVDGAVYTWGKGEHYRLGHGTEDILRYPKKIIHFKRMNVKKIAVGVVHSIALIENGDVYAWGKKEYAHPAESERTGKIPELVSNIRSNNIFGLACGITQSYAWGIPNNFKIGVRVPFLTDICKSSMHKINKLLSTVCDGITISDRPPNQENECLIVGAFNILQLQLHAISVNNIDVRNLDLDVQSSLLDNIKQTVIDIASTSGVLDTIQSAAQVTLQVGWSILLPTTAERAKTLSSLITSSDWNCSAMSQGQHFMTDLLVSSLMADGGLEISLQAAIKAEIFEPMREELCSSNNNMSQIPLVRLVKQLLRNCLSQTLMNLHQLKPTQTINERSPSLTLLLRFQRLLVAQLHQHKSIESRYSWDCDDRNTGAESLLQKYLKYVIKYVSQVLNTATEIAYRSSKHFYAVSNILKCNGIDILLPELLLCLVMLHEKIPLLLHNIDWFDLFLPLFNALECFNGISPHLEKEDDDDMSWTGVTVNPCIYKSPDEMPSFRKMDIENHNKDGGCWIMYNNKVYDIRESDAQGEMENLRKYVTRNTTTKNEDLIPPPQELLQACYVGNYLDQDEDTLQSSEISCISSPLLDAQRTLSYLLGFHARCMIIGTPLSSTEKEMVKWLSAPYLKGGLTPLNPYEEKDEARTTNTTPTEPFVKSSAFFSSNFENPTNEIKLMDTVTAFDIYLSRIYKKQMSLMLNTNHPVEEVNRMLLAALIKHLGLGHLVIKILSENSEKYVEQFEIIANVLHKTKLKLIQMKQEQNQSYKELCVPFLNKLKFLLCEVKPATSYEVNAIDRLQLLHTDILFKKVAKHVIADIKKYKCCNSEKLENSTKTENIKKSCEKKLINTLHKEIIHVQPGKSDLIHAIVYFVIEENSADIELIRKAMIVQAERCNMQKEGYSFMLKLLSLPTIVSSVKCNLVNGWLFTSSIFNNSNDTFENAVTPHQKAELLLAKSKILDWTISKLRETIRRGSYSSRFSPAKDKNGCYSQRRLCWTRLVLSMICLLSEISSSDEVTLIVNSGVFAYIEYIFKESDMDVGSKSCASNNMDCQAIFEEDQNYIQFNNESTRNMVIPVTSGPNVVPYIKPGLRVVRGPDWKWGDQDRPTNSEGTVVGTISSDGWVPVKWDSGAGNTYRMGKDGKYDLQLAPYGNELNERSLEKEENIKDVESEKIKLRNPNSVLRKASITLLKILFLCGSFNSNKIQFSCVQNMSQYMRYSLQERSKHNMLMLSNNCCREWITLSFIKVIARSKSICLALCSPQWLKLLFNIISSRNSYPVNINTRIQTLRLLQVVLLVGLKDNNMFENIIEKLFFILGNIAIYCYPNLNFAENKFSVTLTASATSTIVEEFIQLLRKMHSSTEWTDMFNAFLIKKLAVAADCLTHSSFSVQNENEEKNMEIQYYSIATLLVLGGLDSRLRLGGDVIESTLRTGTVCNITSKTRMITVQMHKNDKVEQFNLSSLKVMNPPQFQLEKLPTSDSFLDTWATLLSTASFTYSYKNNATTINIPLLRNQQQTLAVIRACRLLLNYQFRLRKVLKRPTLEPHMSLEALNDSDIIGDATQSLLLHQLIVNAVQPSQLKPHFSRKELEEAAINVSQYLAVNLYSKSETINNNDRIHSNNVMNDQSVRCSSPSIMLLMAQLVEMGFSKKSVEAAIKATEEVAESHTIENLVAWLLEHSEECQLTDNQFNFFDSKDRCNITNIHSTVSKVFPTIFKKRNEFTNADEYAMYIRNNCAIGMLVRCCRSYEEEVYEGDTGIIVKINNGELHDLNLQVDWRMKGYAYWVRFIHVELLGNVNNSSSIKIGDTVRVKPSIVTPQYKWGSVSHTSVGIVTAINGNNNQVTVDFPQQTNWIGNINEMEVLLPYHQEVACSNCFMRPIIGARFKCRICENFNFCENCFYTPFDHQHNFVRIAEPGNAAIFAGKPRKIERNGIFISFESDIIEDNASCIKYLTTSSRENWAHYLLDVHSNNYWQSCCASPEKHWIHLEICPDVLIHSLKMKVEPSDNSYMPKLVKVSVGNSFTELKELAVVSIHPRDTIVSLLSEIHVYYSCVEISINQCVNGGVNCRVHAIYVTGRKKCSADLPNSAPFLALDFNDTQNNVQYIKEPTNFGILLENKVFVWGLNDKDQLGGLKGSKIKFPAYSETLSALKPIHIAGGSKSLFIVSHTGKVYACGETMNGRLGLGTNVISPVPRQILMLDQYIIKKVAVHSGGKHAMALTLSGRVFSWGEGDDGKLGHGNSISLDQPKMIEYFKSKRIREIACGSAYSAAITSCGELYTWGLGDYGRLGHGDNVTQYKPKLIRALLGRHIVKVACGSRDAQTLALDNEGTVYSWGDGDFGKLGRGGSEACDIPCSIEYLNGKGVIHIDCGAQFSLALTKSGQVWTWGKGDYYRLGHGTDQHIRKPTLLAALKGVHIIDCAAGALHCLAVSSTGVVYSWGDNDHGQQGNGSTMVNQVPTRVDDFGNVKVNRVACGSSHSIAWQSYEPLVCSSTDPVTFSSVNDTLGANILGINENSSDDEKKSLDLFSQPSLSKQILSLESDIWKQTALQYVLNSLRIMFARDAIVAALSTTIKMEDNVIEENDDFDGLGANSSNELTESSVSTIARGGGEAPAPAIEFSDELISSQSNMTTPDEVENPLNAFSSVGSSSSTSHHVNISRMSASTMSMIAVTLKSNSQLLGITETEMANSSLIDDFIGLLGSNDVRILVDLLKLAVAGRVEDNAKETLTNVLKVLASNKRSIAAMLLEFCVIELEDIALNNNILKVLPQPVIQESVHPYNKQVTSSGVVRIPGADSLRIEFDRRCGTEKNRDTLTIYNPTRSTIYVMSGREWSDWSIPLFLQGEELRWKFTRDVKNNGWGWRFTVYPIIGKKQFGSDRDILSKPSMDVVVCLLDTCLASNNELIRRLITALASCAQLNILDGKERTWCLDKLCQFTKPPFKKILSSPTLSQTEDSPLSNLLKTLPKLLLKQYEYEDQYVKRGKQLMYSSFFKALIALACELELDAMPFCDETGKWGWFRHYCISRRVARALIQRTKIPNAFSLEVRKIIELDSTYTDEYSDDYENNSLFTEEHDEQLLMWLNRKSDDWNISWSASGVIYGWGHNHRGQLGGVNGNQIKIPTPCEALTALRPVQLAGGEQSVFAVTSEGKLYATGFTDKGRLGIGNIPDLNSQNPFVSTPYLVEGLAKVFIKKVAVHSGGKHCLALSSTGSIYAWGDGEDGKLGIGHKNTCDTPCLVESLQDKEIVDISCGGAHSAAITNSGKLYTWGRGRYGRLGHGNGDDHLYPKLVEALLGYKVIDVACGSGDAQTLCITQDDNVWSWGDGDYGKLGRGGADGCSIPMKIECLAGLGVVKVECGSQFSVALTRSGSVYTWGKGDYYRLGHGTDEHVRRPKKVSGLQGKKIVSISTGSLHVVVCSNMGEVFAWGDNDEGQLGDGTLKAVARPRAIPSLQDKNITLVVCGSAHTFAKSSDKPISRGNNMPSQVPLEYDLLQDLPIPLLRNRLVLLHYFSDLLTPIVTMLPLEGDISLHKLRGILVYSAKESIFRKVLNATMAREPHHGPTIDLNRIQIKKSRIKNGYAGPDGIKSVFGQMVQKSFLIRESLLLPHRVWKVQFVGESVDDYGGGYSDSIAEMCEELQNGSLPLLIPTPNGRDDAGTNRDCFILNPSAKSSLHLEMFNFLGVLMGIAIRTGSPLSLSLAESVWKQLVGVSLTIADLTEIDKDCVPRLLFIRDMDSNEKNFFDIPFSIISASGHEIFLSSSHRRVTHANKHEYIKIALNYRLHEFDEQVAAVRTGLARVVPVPLLSLFSSYELETMVCGSPDIPLSLLKSVAVYKGTTPNEKLVQWFWEVMEEFTNQERSLFLRFVWGRTRLPRTIPDFRGRDFVFQVLDKYNPPDHFLPESYTCFFLLKMPRYSNKFVLQEKLKYAIYFCKSIDTDEYARIAIPGADLTSSNSDSDGLESVTGEEITPT